MKSKPVEMVEEFHRTYGLPILDEPKFPSSERVNLRLDLIEEESTELLRSVLSRDIVGVADALADLLYVVIGAALEFGIPLDSVVHEVHQSNMSKLDENGKPIYREDGKVLKGPNFFEPDIKGAMGL